MVTTSNLADTPVSLHRGKLSVAAMISGIGLLLAVPALANPYDDCILQHMANAQNREAVDAIESACISNASTQIPEDEAAKITARAQAGRFSLNGLTAENGLVIDLTNNSDYAITEVSVVMADKTGRVTISSVNVFLAPFYGPGILSGPVEPRFSQIINPGSKRQFFVSTSGIPRLVVPTKGIPPTTTAGQTRLLMRNPSPFDPVFQAAGREWNVDPLLLKAIAEEAMESGAQNLMEIRPDTFKDLGGEDITDPVQQIWAAAKYLSQGFNAGAGANSSQDALQYYHGGPGWRSRSGQEFKDYVLAVSTRYEALLRAKAPSAP